MKCQIVSTSKHFYAQKCCHEIPCLMLKLQIQGSLNSSSISISKILTFRRWEKESKWRQIPSWERLMTRSLRRGFWKKQNSTPYTYIARYIVHAEHRVLTVFGIWNLRLLKPNTLFFDLWLELQNVSLQENLWVF